jgi:hypothetical protein
MPNPFFYGGRIENPDDFVGRKAELRAIFSALATFSSGQAQHISVVGERRIGKSSLLYHVTQTYQQQLSRPDCYRFVFADLENPQNHSLHGLLEFILRKLNLATSHHPSLSEFAEALEKLHDQKHICPVVCLDEFEQLVNYKDEFPNHVYEAFRSLGSNNKVAFLTASKTPLSDLILQSNMTSTFPNIFMQRPLKVFSQAEAMQLLERSSLPFSQSDKAEILRISECYPGKLQLIAGKAYSMLEDGSINWLEIKKEHGLHLESIKPHNHKPTQKIKLSSVLNTIFIRFPREWIGRPLVEIYYKDKDKVSDNAACFWGYIAILIIVLVLTGFLSIEQIKQTLK